MTCVCCRAAHAAGIIELYGERMCTRPIMSSFDVCIRRSRRRQRSGIAAHILYILVFCVRSRHARRHHVCKRGAEARPLQTECAALGRGDACPAYGAHMYTCMICNRQTLDICCHFCQRRELGHSTRLSARARRRR